MAQVGETRLADDQFDRIARSLATLAEQSQTQLPGNQLRHIVAALLTASSLDPEQAITRYQKILARMDH